MKLPAFSVNTVFAVGMLLGVVLIPRLSLQLEPSSRSNTLTIPFWWNNANPEMLEMEVTTRLEGALSRVRGLDEITSTTHNGRGQVTLSINKHENIDAVKLHVSSIIRSLAPTLPEGARVSAVSGGEIRDGTIPVDDSRLLTSHVLTGPGTSMEVARFAEENILPAIALLPGVENVAVTGAVPFEWVMEYDRELFADIGLSPGDIVTALSRYHARVDAGKVLVDDQPPRRHAYIIFKGNDSGDRASFLDLPVKTVNGKMLRLRDLVTLDYREQDPPAYYRINGLNRVNLNVHAAKNTNMLELAAAVKREMAALATGFDDTYSLLLVRDTSTEIRAELDQILYRTAATILILLLFVFIASRDARYLFIIATCLLANMLVAWVFYYFLHVELHLYTLAGIAVSFSIVIDSVIVMTDHYRHYRDRKAFLAILAATLTTMGALAVIFNLEGALMREMWDFSAVIIINLGVSLAVAFFFVPALMDTIPLRRHDPARRHRARRRVARFNRLYRRGIRLARRYRAVLLAAAILGFGLPLFLLPASIPREKWYAKYYNPVFASETYLAARPYIDKALGGALRLFIERDKDPGRGRDPGERQRTRLTLNMTMPHGATIKQMNEAFVRLENFLAGFEQVENFTTTISSANRGNLVILFKEEHEEDGTPELLKNELIRYANTIGNGDSEIAGVGRGFSNRTGSETRSEHLKVVGYNYRKVLLHAAALQRLLEQNIRVKKLYIGKERDDTRVKEFGLAIDKERLARASSNTARLLHDLSSLTYSGNATTHAYLDGEYTTIAIRPRRKVESSIWDIRNRPLRGNRSVFRLDDVGEIVEERAFESIDKRDQEYEVSVHYDFVGAYTLSEKVKKQVIEEMNEKMEVGFRVKRSDPWRWYWARKIGGIDSRIVYIVLVLGIIFFLCSILLESLRQALVVLCIAPISFIGCFLGVWLWGNGFDQGCLAAFILLSGLSVNAVLYILNDYNIKIRGGRPPGARVYLQAYNAKIIPIILTVVSTLLGFLPFLVGEVNPFWRSLAVGTMSGLLFSLPVLVVYLPVMLPIHRQTKKKKTAL
jgi:multidrug efflux pump subunit AcrB